MNSYKISVVTPIYNAEEFLDKSIGCILFQSYKNIELILINDGSTDESLRICEKYLLKDERIKILSQPNRGPASARNLGMDSATGYFIYFLDADDVINVNTFSIMIKRYKENKKADMILSNFGKIDTNGKYSLQKNTFIQNNEKYIEHFLDNPSGHLISFCWARLYKRNIIKKYNIKANESMKLFEDYNFNLKYLEHTKFTLYIDIPLYTHIIPNSMTASMVILNTNQMLHDMEIFKCESLKYFKNVKKIHHALIHYLFIFIIRTCRWINIKNIKTIYKEIKEMINSTLFIECLQDYVPKENNSKILPFLIKYKFTILVIIYCKFKSFKRYGRIKMNKEILEQLQNTSLPIIICGIGVVGEEIFNICKENGIKIFCFTDNRGSVRDTKFLDLEVVFTPELKDHIHNALFIISCVSIKDAIVSLEIQGYENFIYGKDFFKDHDLNQYSNKLNYTTFAIENCVICQEGYLNKDKLFMRSVDMLITERCSLKCKDCSNLMQYYENPKDIDTFEIYNDIVALCNTVDEIMDFRLIGGDVFMNKDWHLILEKASKESKIKRIVLYTNGTIVPNEKHIEALKNKKVLVIVTNYKKLSKKLNKLISLFEFHDIRYHILEVDEWLDCSKIGLHSRNTNKRREIFRVCCAKNMTTFTNGKIFRCPYSANAHRLKAVPDFKSDYVDLYTQTKKDLGEYLNNKKCLITCDYCDGRPLSGIQVEPAIQIRDSIEYFKYE